MAWGLFGEGEELYWRVGIAFDIPASGAQESVARVTHGEKVDVSHLPGPFSAGKKSKGSYYLSLRCC